MTPTPGPTRLTQKRRLAQAALWFEQLWPAIWPAVGVLGLYAGFALFDLPAYLPSWPRIGLFVAVLAIAGFLLWRGLRRIARPSAALADRRLERDSGLAHRPLATLGDRPIDPTPEQEALWRVHIARLAAAIPRLVVTRPRPGLAARDVWALRGALCVFLAAALAVAGPDSGQRLLRAVTPTIPPTPAGPGTQIQAWITPPAYTGLAPVLLRPDTQDLRVPAASRITVSVTGDTSEPSLALDGVSEAFHALDPSSWQADRDLGAGQNGRERVEINRSGAQLAAWTLTLIPDQPPVPLFTEPPAANSVSGRPTLQSRFAWQTTDDYGVTSLQIEMHLTGRPEAPPLIVPVPLAGSPKSAHGVSVPDLTAHPWAGLPVIARLAAKDAPGQIGRSDAAPFTLPAREFQNPVAAALIAVRRQLSLMPEERRAARAVLDAIADQPDSVDNSAAILLNLRALSALLNRGRGQEAVDEAQARMWTLALALEENAPERTAKALEQAREALRDAVDPNQAKTPEQAEIDRKVQELRDAIQKHMEALAEQARRDGTPMPFDPKLPQMNARDLDRMAQQLQQSLKDGRMDDARQQMAELEKLLEALQNARPESGEQRDQQRAERRQRGKEQMDAVQDMVQREGQLLDRSEKRSADQTSPQRGPPQAQPQPQPGQPDPRAGEAKSQSAMRRALGELMQRFGDLTGDVPAPLGEADQAMREAAQALANGRDAAAGAATKRAIEALQKGGRQMGQQVARQFGTGKQPGQGEEGEGEGGGRRANPSAAPRTAMAAPLAPGPAPTPAPASAAPPTATPSAAHFSRAPPAVPKAATSACPTTWNRPAPARSKRNSAAAAPTAPASRNELDYIDRLLMPF